MENIWRETHILVVQKEDGGSTYNWKDALSSLGFRYEKDFDFISDYKLEGSGQISENRAPEDLVPIYEFCKDRPLVVRMFTSDWDEFPVEETYKILSKRHDAVIMGMPDGSERCLGWITWDDFLFRKQVAKSKDFYKKYNGWVLSAELVQSLKKNGITHVRIHDRENGVTYFTYLENYIRYGNEFSHKVEGDQICLDMRFWMTECYDCPLYYVSKGPQVPYSGPFDADVMFVGEAPWIEEVKESAPFVGPSGQFFTKVLKDVGINREACFISNAICCKPEEKKGSKKPPKDALKHCRARLVNEIGMVKPKIIVPLGKVACEMLIPGCKDKSMTHMQESGRHWKTGGDPVDAVIFPMFHPSYFLHNSKWGVGSPMWINRQRARRLREMLDDKNISSCIDRPINW